MPIRKLPLLMMIQFVLFGKVVWAQQDGHFSLYRHHMTIFNPAVTGISNNSFVNLSYKSQWSGIQGAPETQVISFGTPITGERGGRGKIKKMPRPKIFFFPLFFLCLTVFGQDPPFLELPNFEFPDGKNLQDYAEKGLVLVYGDSSCPACQQAQGQLMLSYQQWQAWGYPIVYIAMDSDKKNVDQNFGTPPWALYCDEKSWDSPWVEAADIRGTPTLLVLDKNLKTYYRAKNVAQMDIWLRTQT